MLDLSEVTLCAADSVTIDLTVRALNLSMAGCAFGDAILFSHEPREGAFRWVEIEALRSREAYSRFCLHDMAGLIRTPYALVVQWDGYVVDPGSWSRTFRKYDYIGAIWPQFPPPLAIGNGGFSLRSLKLLKALRQLPILPGYAEDRMIGHVHRPRLEKDFGIKFPPIEVANRFSYETTVPVEPTFGFHGVRNLWRHIDDAELAAIVPQLDLARMNPDSVLLLLMGCVKNGRPRAAEAVFDAFSRLRTPVLMKRVLVQMHGLAEGEKEFALLAPLVAAARL